MRREAARKFSRQLAFEAILKSLLPILIGILVVVGLALWTTNAPVARQTLEGRYVRWTKDQTKSSPSTTRIFIDVPGTGSIMVTAWPNWTPPEPGSMIRVEEQTLRWYGKRYSLVP